MVISNFELIKPLLKFESEDDFYFVQILQRKKDNPNIVKGSNNNNRLIKAYYIKSIEHLDKYKDEMIALANLFNARIGINLNKRSFYKTAFDTLLKMANQMHNRDFTNTSKAYNSACGIHNGHEDKVWLLDIDTKEDFDLSTKIVKYLNDICEPIGRDKLIAVIPSRQGYHLIVKPFNTERFSEQFPDIGIHKNNPTNLYIPDERPL